MGDFAGGLLKYLRRHPLPRLTIGGGFAKITKLAMGFLDLHSGRSQVDFAWLAEHVGELGGSEDLLRAVRDANTAMQVLTIAQQAGLPLADAVAEAARSTARKIAAPETAIDVLIFDRQGKLVGRSHG